MKNVIYAALLLASSTSWASLPVFALNCTNSQNENLSIKEFTSSKLPINKQGIAPKFVYVNYSDAQGQQSFQGKVAILGHSYEMWPTEDGLAVSLDVVAQLSFNHQCGRCPVPVDPVEPEEQTYFAKLTVGSEVHDFVCKKH